MEVVHACCAGLDVHKKTVVACLLQQAAPEAAVQREVRSFSTMLVGLQELGGWLAAAGCTQVVMEATGVYWKPVYNVLEAQGTTVLVVNPEHVKALAGRKTDRKDAQRLADLLRHGLLTGSFIPGRAQRDLRELTRARTALVRERARVVQRLEKTLEGANVKLAAVLTDLLGVSGQRMLDALVEGMDDPEQVAGLAHASLHKKREALEHALAGRLSRPLRFLVQQHLAHWRELDARIVLFDAEVAEVLQPCAELRERLDAIPGVGARTADVVLAEIGAEVSQFPDAAHLAAWAGLSPGNRESGGRRKAARTRHGAPWLKAALTEAAWAATHCHGTYLQSQYQRLARRRGKNRALVAVAHSLVVSIYFMIKDGAPYRDLGEHFLPERDARARERRAIKTLTELGHEVILRPLQPVA